MNNLINIFFTNGSNKEVVDYTIIFIESLVEILDKENNINNNDAIEVYIIDDINSNVYHNERISNACTTFKQKMLVKYLQSSNEEACSNKEQPKAPRENKYIKPITK